MGQSAPQVFSGISPEQYGRLIQKAQAAGIALSGNSGTATKLGVEVSWSYSPTTQELAIQCLSTPFFVKPEEVYARIQALVKESLS
jgi:hypothetical protein